MGEFPRRCTPGEVIALKRWHVRLGFKHVLFESLTRSLLINMHTDTKSSLGMLNIKRSRCLEMAALRFFSLRVENGSSSRGQGCGPADDCLSSVKQLGQPAGPKVGATFPHPALGFLSFLKNIYLAAPSLSWGI